MRHETNACHVLFASHRRKSGKVSPKSLAAPKCLAGNGARSVTPIKTPRAVVHVALQRSPPDVQLHAEIPMPHRRARAKLRRSGIPESNKSDVYGCICNVRRNTTASCGCSPQGKRFRCHIASPGRIVHKALRLQGAYQAISHAPCGCTCTTLYKWRCGSSYHNVFTKIG